MNSYSAYGLCIHSELRLPELPAQDSADVDVVIRFGQVDYGPVESDIDGGASRATAEEAWRYLAGVGAFLVRRGREIIVDPTPGVDERMLRLSILGPALAILLHQRGRFILHASTIARGGNAFALCGASGWGKSTLAAALHARGCGLVSDDLTAIAVSRDRPMVIPGFPQIKLWPEAVASLGEAPETKPQLHPLFDKRAHRVGRGFSHTPVPLRRIYMLADGSAPSLETLHPHEAMVELTGHWYGARFGDRLRRPHGAQNVHFLRCATLANTVRVLRLRRPRDLQALHDLAALVDEDLAHDLVEYSVAERE